MNGATASKGGSLFGSAQTPFDLFCDGKSYGEIVEQTGLDLFTVMAEIAKESTVHAAFRSINPYVEQEYQIHHLHRVIDKAWESYESGAAFDEKDNSSKLLGTIVQAVTGISKVLHHGPASVPGTDEKPKLPDGISPDVIAALGQMQVRSKFNQSSPLRGIDGGKNRQSEKETNVTES
jgi:hypothetical protein